MTEKKHFEKPCGHTQPQTQPQTSTLSEFKGCLKRIPIKCAGDKLIINHIPLPPAASEKVRLLINSGKNKISIRNVLEKTQDE